MLSKFRLVKNRRFSLIFYSLNIDNILNIIILLILAGITIIQLTGSGLFENAKLAEQKTKDAQEKEDITLEQSLQAYRVMNTPTKFSWKQHWAQETFSEKDAFECSADERKQFVKRLRECNITICNGIGSTSGTVGTLEDLVKILIYKVTIIEKNYHLGVLTKKKMNV